MNKPDLKVTQHIVGDPNDMYSVDSRYDPPKKRMF